jgi:hypothetical protein
MKRTKMRQAAQTLRKMITAIDRGAELVRNYPEAFTPEQLAEMRAKVEQMRAQRDAYAPVIAHGHGHGLLAEIDAAIQRADAAVGTVNEGTN